MSDPLWISAAAATVSAAVAVHLAVAKRRAERRAARLEAENIELRDDWIPLHKALNYIALRSDWARGFSQTTGLDLEIQLQNELSEAFARGDVEARGRERVSRMPHQLTASSVAIPQDFWQTAFIQPFAEIVLCDDERGAAATSGQFHSASSKCYRQIRVRKSQVERLWPRAEASAAASSPFHVPLVNYWDNGGSHSNHQNDYEVRQMLLSNARTDC